MDMPPPGVADVFSALMALTARIAFKRGVDKSGKVKDKSWNAAKKTVLSNVSELRSILGNFITLSENMKIPKTNWAEVRLHCHENV